MNRAVPHRRPARPKAPAMLLGLRIVMKTVSLSLDLTIAKATVKLQPPLTVRLAKKTAVKAVCRLTLLLPLLLPAVTASIMLMWTPALVRLLSRQIQGQPSNLLLPGQAQAPLHLLPLPLLQALPLMPV